MDKQNRDQRPPAEGKPPARRPMSGAFVMLGLGLLLGLLLISTFATNRSIIDYSYFKQLVAEGHVARVEAMGDEVFGEFTLPPPLDSEFDPQGRRRTI